MRRLAATSPRNIRLRSPRLVLIACSTSFSNSHWINITNQTSLGLDLEDSQILIRGASGLIWRVVDLFNAAGAKMSSLDVLFPVNPNGPFFVRLGSPALISIHCDVHRDGSQTSFRDSHQCSRSGRCCSSVGLSTPLAPRTF